MVDYVFGEYILEQPNMMFYAEKVGVAKQLLKTGTVLENYLKPYD